MWFIDQKRLLKKKKKNVHNEFGIEITKSNISRYAYFESSKNLFSLMQNFQETKFSCRLTNLKSHVAAI